MKGMDSSESDEEDVSVPKNEGLDEMQLSSGQDIEEYNQDSSKPYLKADGENLAIKNENESIPKIRSSNPSSSKRGWF